MAAIDFEGIFKTLKDGVVQLAGKTGRRYVLQAKESGLGMLNDMRGNLSLWSRQVKDGEMNAAEFEDLLKGQVTDTKLTVLKQAGIAQIELDKFKKGLVDLIVNTISSVI